MMKLLQLLLPLLLLLQGSALAFQSDELPDDADEWGLVGGEPAIGRRTPEKVDIQYKGNLNVGARQSSSAGATGDKKITFALEHAFGDAGFTPAGVFSARLRTSGQGRVTLTKLRLVRDPLSIRDHRSLEDLVKADGFYSVRIPANLVAPRNVHVVASIKARCLAASGLKERFDLHLEQGRLIGITYSPVGDCPYPRPEVVSTGWTFSSLIVTKSSEQAPRLVPVLEDTSSIRVGEKIIEGEDGVVKVVVEKTFWQKYWMYIVPLGLIVVNAITQIANMPEDAPAGQGGAAPTTPAAPVQRISGSGGGRRR